MYVLMDHSPVLTALHHVYVFIGMWGHLSLLSLPCTFVIVMQADG